MLYAAINADSESLHFQGEVNPYDLQTLQLLVGSIPRLARPVRLRIAIDPEDEITFRQWARKRVPRWVRSGVEVEVERHARSTVEFDSESRGTHLTVGDLPA
jgi:hypothetical protein